MYTEKIQKLENEIIELKKYIKANKKEIKKAIKTSKKEIKKREKILSMVIDNKMVVDND